MTSDSIPLILVVDDEPGNRILLERLLSRDYQVFSVPDGQSALDALSQAPFDLALVDIMMPGMSGLLVLQHVRHDPVLADLPVVLISALSRTDDVTRGFELGANDYITKPLDVDVMLARVRTQIRLKRLEDERKHTIQQLEAAQEWQDRLLRIASHDLKGPINNIDMAIGLILNYADAIPDGEDILNAVKLSVESMETVITDFLDTAAVSPEALRLSPVEVDVSSCVAHLVKQYTMHAAQKDIRLIVGDVGGILYADRSRFEQALSNLVSNAIKYSPPGSDVHIWTENAGSRIRVCVADQGPGIPDNERDLLFTQFGKLSARPTGGEKSTGLGLWIVKHLVEMQDGDVGVDNNTSGGSTFWIELANAHAPQPEYSRATA
ncbi:MAG: HAMP domain-containing histidine kinase [Anaerolineae bacterium]|nr:HAMP domain-containing histidine kinase [Anaerolineae bacterium]